MKEAVRPIVSTRKAEQKVNDLAQQIPSNWPAIKI